MIERSIYRYFGRHFFEKKGRLPTKTFSETMLIEAKLLAQLHVTEAMLDSAYNTLHTK